eukprot:GHVU01163352.1.p1 GENE.GHVU01163352.1~~GHVU01163352.1.p1  ORF type:complete len:144 (-),score=13.25 GHVU01163352.1:14-445(-)
MFPRLVVEAKNVIRHHLNEQVKFAGTRSLPDLSVMLSESSFLDEIKQIIKTTVLEAVAEAIEPLKSKINGLETVIKQKTIENRELKNTVESQKTIIQSLCDKTDALEQYSRRSTVRLFNVDSTRYKNKLDVLVDASCFTKTYL